jgi:hypothetical protein
MRAIEPLAQLVVHRTDRAEGPVDVHPLAQVLGRGGPGLVLDVGASPEVDVQRGAVVGRFTGRRQLTETGFDLIEPVSAAVEGWVAALTEGTPSKETIR